MSSVNELHLRSVNGTVEFVMYSPILWNMTTLAHVPWQIINVELHDAEVSWILKHGWNNTSRQWKRLVPTVWMFPSAPRLSVPARIVRPTTYPTAKRDPAHRWCVWWPDGLWTEKTSSRFHPWRGQEMLSERTAVSSSTGKWGEHFLSHLEPHRHIRCEPYPRNYFLFGKRP